MSDHAYCLRLEENLASFLQNWGPITWSSDLVRVGRRPDQGLADMLAALSDIEDESFYMQVKIRYSGNERLAAVRSFNAIWLAEESEHARALAALSLCYGRATTRYRRRARWYTDTRSIKSVPVLKVGAAVYPKGMLAAYLTVGGLQEYVALTSYNAIAELTGDPVAKDILSQIARQEGRHMRFYRRGAEAVLDNDVRCQRFVRTVLSRFWRPPGVDLLGVDNWTRIFRPVLDDPTVVSRFRRLDDLCGELPGLDGMRLMGPFLDRYVSREIDAVDVGGRGVVVA
jgi:hypothetical protein